MIDICLCKGTSLTFNILLECRVVSKLIGNLFSALMIFENPIKLNKDQNLALIGLSRDTYWYKRSILKVRLPLKQRKGISCCAHKASKIVSTTLGGNKPE